MRRRYTYLLALIPFLALFLLTPGCGKKEIDDPEDLPSKKKFSFGKGKGEAVSRGDPLKAPLDGVIRGRVVLEGEMPPMAIIESMAKHSDHQGCLAGEDFEKIDQRWIIGKERGVANVVVSIKPPSGKYFALRDEDKKRTDQVSIDQPHCAFVPHVQATFPMYWDGKELQLSGQEFVVKNSARFNHNTSWKGDPLKSGGGNRTLNSGQELPIKLVPESNPIQISCDIHPWMNARVWAFDHPYFAVTKSDGTFEIKHVPTGVDVHLVAWHEVPGFFHGGKEGTKSTFKPGDNTIELKVKAK